MTRKFYCTILEYYMENKKIKKAIPLGCNFLYAHNLEANVSFMSNLRKI